LNKSSFRILIELEEEKEKESDIKSVVESVMSYNSIADFVGLK
jgi:hypothetical protein